MLCLSDETLSLASARLIRLFSIPIVACFALSLAAATEPPPIKQLHANGINLAYVEEGKGTTVVFVHGANGDWPSWELFRPAVAERYRYVSYSRRYHLPNPWPGDGSASIGCCDPPFASPCTVAGRTTSLGRAPVECDVRSRG